VLAASFQRRNAIGEAYAKRCANTNPNCLFTPTHAESRRIPAGMLLLALARILIVFEECLNRDVGFFVSEAIAPLEHLGQRRAIPFDPAQVIGCQLGPVRLQHVLHVCPTPVHFWPHGSPFLRLMKSASRGFGVLLGRLARGTQNLSHPLRNVLHSVEHGLAQNQHGEFPLFGFGIVSEVSATTAPSGSLTDENCPGTESANDPAMHSDGQTPVLSALAAALSARGIEVDPRVIAMVILDLTREELQLRGPRGLADWIEHLAVELMRRPDKFPRGR
jgi:hypothetical protein